MYDCSRRLISKTVMISWWLALKSRSGHPEVFCEKGVLKNFATFTRKYLRQSLIFNKVAIGLSKTYRTLSKNIFNVNIKH